MAFIRNIERKKLIRKTEQNYGLRKFLITGEITLLLGFIVMTFVSFYKVRQDGQESIWQWFTYNDKKICGLTRMGIGMLVWAIVVVVFGIVSLVLTWSLKSPKTIKKTINKLNSSALSGKKIRGKKAVDITRSRTTIAKK